MIEPIRILTLFGLICINYIFLSTSIWVWTPDLFVVFILFLTTLNLNYQILTYLFYMGLPSIYFLATSLYPIRLRFLIGAYLSFPILNGYKGRCLNNY